MVIIGSGIAGSISAAILAKHGLKTLILDAGQHPRFSIGEAMPPRERPAPAPPRATLRDPRTGLHPQS
ncbi:NAD(P)-binding protein [Pseudomonas aeruginosa]